MSGSSAEDTKRLAYDFLDTARQNLVRILIAFLIGLFFTIIFLRRYAFDAIQDQALSRAMGYEPTPEVIFLNPFEVIILQAKIGVVVGVVFVVPFVVYLARGKLRRRGFWIPPTVSRQRIAVYSVLAAVLFVAGTAYAYFVMIPIILDFIVFIAVEAEVVPLFRISSFVGFVLVYSLIFGIAAQLPLLMLFSIKTDIVSYRFYRKRWRHFVIAAAIVAMLITSPDPITQLIVLGPVVGIYFLGLGVAKVLAREKIREQEGLREPTSGTEGDRPGSSGSPSESIGLPLSESESPTEAPSRAPNGGEATRTEPASPMRSGASAAFSSATGGLLDRGFLDIGAAVLGDMKTHSKKLGAVFLVTSSVVFTWLIYRGIASVRDQTLSQMNPELAGQVNVVQLEIFEFVFLVVKYSAIAGAVAVVPFGLYYSRKTLIEEGVVSGDASYFYYVSRGTVVFGLFLAGGAYAYYGIIPILVSILSNSIVENGMNATFTIGDFVDFVVLLTVLIGAMAELPATMYFLVSSRFVRYETLKAKWRHFTIGVLAVGAVVTSPDPFTMLVVAVPMSGFYLVSLGTTRVLCHRTITRVRAERKELGLDV